MYTVLIVDDEEPVLSSYGFLLESGIEGFSLAGKARSGYEAIKLMYELRPDVVFMDINMPGLDGLDTIAEVHDKFPDVVFVLSTAYERFDLARKAIPLGVHAYLVKPVTKKTFIETLEGIRATLVRRRSSKVSSPENDVVRQFMKEDIWREIEPKRLILVRNRAWSPLSAWIQSKSRLFPRLTFILNSSIGFFSSSILISACIFFPEKYSGMLLKKL